MNAANAHAIPPRRPPDAVPSRLIEGGNSGQPSTASGGSSSRRRPSTTSHVFSTDSSTFYPIMDRSLTRWTGALRSFEGGGSWAVLNLVRPDTRTGDTVGDSGGDGWGGDGGGDGDGSNSDDDCGGCYSSGVVWNRTVYGWVRSDARTRSGDDGGGDGEGGSGGGSGKDGDGDDNGSGCGENDGGEGDSRGDVGGGGCGT